MSKILPGLVAPSIVIVRSVLAIAVIFANLAASVRTALSLRFWW